MRVRFGVPSVICDSSECFLNLVREVMLWNFWEERNRLVTFFLGCLVWSFISKVYLVGWDVKSTHTLRWAGLAHSVFYTVSVEVRRHCQRLKL